MPTSDTMILPKGTAYQTDAGMCGDYSGVIGFETQAPIDRLCRRYSGTKLVPLNGTGELWGTFIETDDATGLAAKIEQIHLL